MTSGIWVLLVLLQKKIIWNIPTVISFLHFFLLKQFHLSSFDRCLWHLQSNVYMYVYPEERDCCRFKTKLLPPCDLTFLSEMQYWVSLAKRHKLSKCVSCVKEVDYISLKTFSFYIPTKRDKNYGYRTLSNTEHKKWSIWSKHFSYDANDFLSHNINLFPVVYKA